MAEDNIIVVINNIICAKIDNTSVQNNSPIQVWKIVLNIIKINTTFFMSDSIFKLFKTK